MKIAETKVNQIAVLQRDGYKTLAFKTPNCDLRAFENLDEELLKSAYISLEIKKKKSSTANAYMWMLLGKIANAIDDGISKYDVYREILRKMDACVIQKLSVHTVDFICQGWESQGVGWQTEELDRDEENVYVMFYEGSSAFDSFQQHRFIDLVVEEAKSYGIETMSTEELKRMKFALKG